MDPASSQKILEDSEYSLAKLRAQAGKSHMYASLSSLLCRNSRRTQNATYHERPSRARDLLRRASRRCMLKTLRMLSGGTYSSSGPAARQLRGQDVRLWVDETRIFRQPRGRSCVAARACSIPRVRFRPCKKRSITNSSANVRFLDLMSSSPASFFVPTLDIDLVWHTHQLFASWYRAHCDIYIAKFIDQ
jgi:Glycine-rich domain-containing protein-like